MSISATSSVSSAAAPASAQARVQLSPEQLAQIAKLKQRDTEVRQHELAHLSAAGGLATSGPSYTYQRGANGVNYAVGGEVNIDTSPGATPQETVARAQIIQAAALAPAEPSAQDRAVAARAQQLAQQARAELERAYAPGTPGAPGTTAAGPPAAGSAVDVYA